MLAMGETALNGLDTIEKLTHVGGPKAEAALVGIRAVLEALREGFAGSDTPQSVLQRIETLHEHIQTADDAALAALKARFAK